MCTLPPMPAITYAHTQSAFTACGGGGSTNTCFTFREGRWETLNDQLKQSHHKHASWMNQNGDILLLGGIYGNYRTELVYKNGSNVMSFWLEYPLIDPCTIEFSDSFIVTGGVNKYVSMYDENGWIRDYPNLSAVRQDHGCGFYMNDDMKMVLLVTGGYYGEMDDTRRLEETSSTEVYVEGASAWTKGPPLPRALIGLRGVSVNNEILMIGGGDITYGNDDVLKFNPSISSWTNVGHLAEERVHHAVSKVNLLEAYRYCDITPPSTTTIKTTTTTNGAKRLGAIFSSLLILLFFSLHI